MSLFKYQHGQVPFGPYATPTHHLIQSGSSMCNYLYLDPKTTQRAQYPLIKEYGLNYIGLHTMN